jgi:putative ABC transport system permease protein
VEPAGDIRYVYIFSGVGAFILLIACINFMNLSTARSAGRAKEVGLRKTLGSQRRQMVFQFLSESFIYSSTAVVAAIGTSYLLLPQFNLLSGKNLTFVVLTQPSSIVTIIILVIVVGLLAGSYPAFYLTSFKAVEVLKGKLRAGMKSKGVRSSLVVVQFILSTIMIIATVVVFKQLSYMQNKQLGLDQHHLINISNLQALRDNRMAFKNEVEGFSSVEVASFSNNSFPGINNTTVFKVKGSDADFISGKYWTDWDQLDVMKFKMVDGRFFSRDFASDSSACVINQAAVKEFGLTNPLTDEIIDFNDDVPDTIRVIGVVENFNFESLQTSVRPMIIRLKDISSNMAVRYSGDPRNMVASLDQYF